MSSQSNYAAAAANNAISGLAWSSYTAAQGIADSTDATCPLTTGSQSDGLQCFAYGFSIPPFVTIDGVEVIPRWRCSTAGISDYSVRLTKAGGAVGSDRASGYTLGAYATPTYGSPTDLWGTTLSVADVNATAFGCELRVQGAGAFPDTGAIDCVQMVVFYSSGGGAASGAAILLAQMRLAPRRLLLPGRRRFPARRLILPF